MYDYSDRLLALVVSGVGIVGLLAMSGIYLGPALAAQMRNLFTILSSGRQ